MDQERELIYRAMMEYCRQLEAQVQVERERNRQLLRAVGAETFQEAIAKLGGDR